MLNFAPLHNSKIYNQISTKAAAKAKQLAILIDPDKQEARLLIDLACKAQQGGVDYLFLGGSLLSADTISESISVLRHHCELPVILFPGSTLQINHNADAILFLSLISGRNPDLLIGQHVLAAPLLKASALEVISTGYMLIDSGRPTTVSYISNTQPIPHDKNDIAVCTAIAGEMLGLKMIFMDGGSGALNCVSPQMIEKVKQNISIPLLVGGGIRSAAAAKQAFAAGADLLIVGNALEKNPALLEDLVEATI